MADDRGMGVVGDMEHAESLHIRPVADPDKMHISANDGMEPDAAVLAQHHIADDDAGLFDKAGCGNGWFNTVKCADHAAHCRGISRQPARGKCGVGLFMKAVYRSPDYRRLKQKPS